MHTLKQDVIHGLRLLWKSPAFTIVSALTLALGIGANTSIFSMVSWLLLRPLPVQRPMDLVELAFQQRHGNVLNQFSIPDFEEIREQSGTQFEDIAAYQIGMDGLSVNHRAERLMTYFVSGNFFSTLGLTPAVGRLLVPGEGDHAGADPVIVLGYAFWKSRFNGDPSIVGRKVLVNGKPFTVVGIGPKGFHGPYPILEAQAFLPMGMKVIEGMPPDVLQNRGNRNTVLLAELRPGVGLEQARAALKSIGQRLSREHPQTDQDLDLHFYMDPSELGYGPSETQTFYTSLLGRVRALPGIESATTASSAPMGYYNNADSVIVDGYEPPPGQPRPGSFFEVISSDYFRTLRIPTLSGREFTSADGTSAPLVAVVNQTFAQRYWPTQDPIGRTFRMASDAKHTLRIVGVAADARYNGITGKIQGMFYVPLAQHLDLGSLQTLEVRTAGDPAAQIPVVERLVAGMAPALPVFDVKTMTQGLDTLNGLMVFQLGAGLAAILGVLGLILSVVGVYGVISYSAAQRTQEIGVRMALGARPADILWMVLRHGSIVVASGLVFGLLCAFGAGRLIQPFLVVNPADPLTYATVSGLLAIVALTACYLPARRSTTVDPIIALRE